MRAPFSPRLDYRDVVLRTAQDTIDIEPIVVNDKQDPGYEDLKR